MMIVQIDKMSAPSTRERVQRLYKKNIELEKQRQIVAQSQRPSDTNAWHQMRENYEAIILEDHDFSEQRNVEYALWQLHYKRIEEFRSLYNNALASAGSKSIQGAKGPTRPDRLGKLRMQFRTFLAEASGFYHDLIMKIRAKYGLPLSNFSDESEIQIISEKDAKKSAHMRKGLVSCHRCLIYLGDLARYKGSYGDGDSKNREYVAASSYYLQAASLCPFIGNPHHQLAILASYLGDELVVIYRYYRSLAVEVPFATARDNLILAFEKNRQSCALLPGDVKMVSVKESSRCLAGKGRGRINSKTDSNVEADHKNDERPSVIPDTFKSFCTRFVRINGILFTRTSLETFADMLSLVSSELCQLLSSAPEEALTFGTNDMESGLMIVRIVAILIFNVHNVNKQNDSQTYADIVQRAVLLRNAYTAAFDLVGRIVERCSQLRDPSSSFLLPGILVFVEWLAFHPDLAAGKDVDDNEAAVRTKFWNLCVSFFNNFFSLGFICLDDEEQSCFNSMSKYEEGSTENQLALWEDFELRGFLPLVPAQSILDFSRKPSFGGEGDKERKARVKRILTAGKALVSVARVDQKNIYFDEKAKRFLIGANPQMTYDFTTSLSSAIPFNDLIQENPIEKTKLDAVKLKQNQFTEGEDDDEVIVFKPLVVEKQANSFASKWAANGNLGPIDSRVDLKLRGNSSSLAIDSPPKLSAFQTSFHVPESGVNIVTQNQLPVQIQTSACLVEDVPLATSMQGFQLMENGHQLNSEMPEAVATCAASGVPIQQFIDDTGSLIGSTSKASEAMVPSKAGLAASSVVVTDNMAVKTASALQTGVRRPSVSRPARHIGPPPGFSHVPPKQVNEPSVLGLTTENPILDDYSWLDGYHVPSSTKGCERMGVVTCVNPYPQQVSNSNDFGGTVNFPFPGKLIPTHMERENGGQANQRYENMKAHNDQRSMKHQPHTTGNQHFTAMSRQFQGHSIWSG